MFKKSKRLLGLCLGVVLSLGVGVGLGNTHGEANEIKAESSTVTYKPGGSSKEGWSVTTSGTAPSGSSATYTQTYGTLNQITSNNSTTLTLSGYSGYKITGLVLSMKSNSSKGAGTFSLKAGTTTLAEISSATNFNSWYDNTSFGDSYRDVNVTLKNSDYSIASGENVVVSIAATTNSLYIQSYKFTYEEAVTKTLTSISLTDNRTDEQKVYTEGETFSATNLTVTAHYSDAEDEDVTSLVSWNKTTLATGDTEVIGTYQGETVNVSITVNAYAYEGDGTLENPYSIDDAVRLANLGGKENVYVKATGKPSYASSYGNYTVKCPNSTDTKFTFYRLYADVNKTKFPSNTLGEKDNTEVLAFGNITLYNGAAQFAEGCYIYDYKATSIAASEPTKLSSFKAGDTITSLDQLGVNVTANIEVTNEQRDVTSEATIDKITLAKGTNTITVKYTQTNKYSNSKTNNTELTTTITLNDIPQKATKVEITSTDSEVNIGETITLTAKVSPDDTTDPTVTWSSDDESIATVDSKTGVVTGVKAGEVLIIATCDDVSDEVVIEVKDPTNVLSKLIVSGTCQSEYFVGETFDPTGLTVKGQYSDGITEIDVTNDVVWPTEAFTTADEATIISVSYTYVENGETKTLTNDEAEIVSVVEKVLSSISVSGQKTEYTVNDTSIDTSLMVVTASYENTTRTEDVTNADSVVVSSDIDFTLLGNKEVSVSYTENGVTKSTTYIVTVGVGDMTVKVKTQGTPGYKKVAADKTDWSGTYLIVYEDGGVAYNGNDTANKGNYSVTISNSFITYDESYVTVTISKTNTDGKYSILLNGGTNSGKYVGKSSNSNGTDFKDAAVNNTININSDGTINIIGSGGAYFRYNSSNGECRFRYFKSSTYTDQKAVCLYEYFNGETIVEHNVTATLYTAVQKANNALVCGSSSTGSWVDGSYDEATAKGYLEALDATDLSLLKTAEANKEGNLVEYFLWKYDYLVSTNKISNFLGRNTVSSNANLIYKVSDSNTAILVVVLVSFTSITAIGGYFFIRKRKYN